MIFFLAKVLCHIYSNQFYKTNCSLFVTRETCILIIMGLVCPSFTDALHQASLSGIIVEQVIKSLKKKNTSGYCIYKSSKSPQRLIFFEFNL